LQNARWQFVQQNRGGHPGGGGGGPGGII